MALRNILGSLALDSTLQDILNRQKSVVISDTMPAGNSFDGSLSADEVKAGSWEDLEESNASALRVTLRSDQDSATDGFLIEWSHDGSFKIESEDPFFIAADTGKTFTFGRAARYFRVVYTNGSTPSSRTVIATSLFRGPAKWSSHKINEGIDNETDAEMVKAVITGRIASGPQVGEYVNVSVTPQGRLAAEVTGQTIGDPVGTAGFLELHEDPSGNNQPAQQDASGNLLVKEDSALNRNNLFATLVNAQPSAITDEIRMDDGETDDHLYIGRNANGTATSDASWEIVKITRTATGLTQRIQYVDSVAWDNRTGSF